MARPKKDESLHRGKRVYIRFTELEYELVAGYAKDAGYPIGTFVRKQALREKLEVNYNIVADLGEIQNLTVQAAGICQREGLHQVDLLSPAADKITQQEYHAQRRGQLNLDIANMELLGDGITPMHTTFETNKEKIRNAISDIAERATSFEEFQRLLKAEYGILVKDHRGRFSYLPADRQKFISARALGSNYDRDRLLRIFAENALLTCSLTLTFPFLLLLFLVHLCQQLYQGCFQNLCRDFSSFDAQRNGFLVDFFLHGCSPPIYHRCIRGGLPRPQAVRYRPAQSGTSYGTGAADSRTPICADSACRGGRCPFPDAGASCVQTDYR